MFPGEPWLALYWCCWFIKKSCLAGKEEMSYGEFCVSAWCGNFIDVDERERFVNKGDVSWRVRWITGTEKNSMELGSIGKFRNSLHLRVAGGKMQPAYLNVHFLLVLIWLLCFINRTTAWLLRKQQRPLIHLHQTVWMTDILRWRTWAVVLFLTAVLFISTTSHCISILKYTVCCVCI